MKLTFIGTGGAFSGLNPGNSNMVLEHNGKRMLIDCGTTCQYLLPQMGLKPTDIDAVYVSHLHADHTGSLEWLGFYNKFLGVDRGNGEKRPILFGVRSVVTDLWDKTLSGGMESIEGEDATLSTFFRVKPVESGGKFVWEGWEFQTLQTVHVMGGYKIQPSFGLLIQHATKTSKTTLITTDTQFTWPTPLLKFYQQADLIFHDCEVGFKSGVHANFQDMLAIPEDQRSKMWLYHNTKECDLQGFAGFVKQGQSFEL